MYKKPLQYVTGIVCMMAMAATTFAVNYYPTQTIASPNAPASCQDNGTVYNNKRYYKGATFYPYDVMYGDPAYRWAIDRPASMISIYNPFGTFTIQGPSGGFVFKSNSKPTGINAVLAAQNDSGTVVNGPNPTSATTRALQIAYNISRKPLYAGAGASWNGGLYYESLGGGNFGPATSWTWTAWAYGAAQNGLECANYYVSRCGDGVVDNGSALPGATPKTDAYGYNIWNGTLNSMNAGEQCDLGALNGQAGQLCNALCQAIPAPVYPDMTIVKSVVGATTGYASGATITYNLLYKNIGTGTANGIVVSDTLPAGLTFVSASPTQTSVAGQTITWNIPGTLAQNQQGVITVTVKVNAAGVCTTLNNTASVSATNEQNTTLGNNTSSASVTTACPQPDVWTLKTNTPLQGTYMPGKKVRYTISYGNQGQGVANGVIVTDTLPAGVTYVAGSATSTPSIGQPTVAGQTLTWNVGTLPAGANGTVSIDVTINANTPTCTNLSLNNLANISANNEPVGVLSNNPSNSSFVMQCIDLWSLKSVNTPTVQSGDTVTYTITYGNSGSIPSTGNVVDTLPAGMVFVAGSSSSTPNLGAPTVAGQTLTWNAGTMSPGFQGVIAFQAKIIAMTNGQQYVNNVCINGDNNYNNNNCDDATSAGFVNFDLSINKTPKITTVSLNDAITYTLTVQNNGQVGVNGFSVKDYLPAGLQFVSASAGGTYNAGTHTVTWNGLNIGAVATLALTVNVKYVGPITNGQETNWTEICNYNGISGTPNLSHDIDSNPCNGTGNNEDDISSGVIIPTVAPGYIDVSINKLVNGVKSYMAFSGETVTYSLVVKNDGTAAVTNASVNDYLPVGVEYISSSPSATYNASTHTVTWNGVNLAANGGTQTLTITAKYHGNVTRTNYTEVCNYVGTSQSGGANPSDIDSNPCNGTGNNEDDTSNAVITPSYIDLNINKLANGVKDLQANSGDVINFTLVVGNSGNAVAGNFSVTDYLPVGFIFIQADNGGGFGGMGAGGGGAGGSGANQTLAGMVVWNNLSLAPGQTITLSFSAKYVGTEAKRNDVEVCTYRGENTTGSVSGPADIDSDPCDNGANPDSPEDDDSSATVRPRSDKFDLSINKLINGVKALTSIGSGTQVSVKLTVTNSGTVGVTNFSVKDYMPVGLEYVSGSSNQAAASVSYNTGTRQITFSNLNIGAQGSFDITFNAIYADTATRVNYTEICTYNGMNYTGTDAKDIDSNSCNRGPNAEVEDDESSASIGPGGGGGGGSTFDVAINKLVNGVKTYAASNGETVTFTLEVANDGNTTQNNVSVRDVLPVGINYVAGTAQPSTAPVSVTYDASGRVLTWSGLTLPNNAKINLTFQATYTDTVSRTNQVEVCNYRGKGLSQPAGTVAQDPDSAPCNGFIGEDDDSSATITPKTGGGGGGGGYSNRCGDGIIARPNSAGQYEQCDDGDSTLTGNGSAGSTCSKTCQSTSTTKYCGNGTLDAGEACDYKSSNVTSSGVITSGPFKGKVCTSSCQIKGVKQPQCDYIDPPSVQEGEYLPIRWDLERNFATVNSASECAGHDGAIIKDTLNCQFTVTDANNAQVGNPFTLNCAAKISTSDHLIKNAYEKFMKSYGYNPDDTSLKYGMGYWKVPTGGRLGEYKIAMSVTSYKRCENIGTGTTTVTIPNSRVCEMNFVVTKPYMVNRGAFGDFATDNLKTFYQMPYGTPVFPLGVSVIDNKLDATQAVKDDVNKLVDSYKKLAVAAGDMKLNAQIGTAKEATSVKISKVPNKEIYIFEADNNDANIVISDKMGSNPTKAFTLIVTRGNLVVKDDVSARGMYIVTQGMIKIKPSECVPTQTSDGHQVIKGIYISTKNGVGIESLTPWGDATNTFRSTMLNSDLKFDQRCTAGDLTVQGVLIGDGLENMYAVRRSNANEWFNADVSRKEDILNHGSVVIKYNTDIFDHLPPGAEVLSQALSVYKK